MKKYAKLETVGAVERERERERERETLYSTWKKSIIVFLQKDKNKSSYNQPHVNNKICNITRQVDL